MCLLGSLKVRLCCGSFLYLEVSVMRETGSKGHLLQCMQINIIYSILEDGGVCYTASEQHRYMSSQNSLDKK